MFCIVIDDHVRHTCASLPDSCPTLPPELYFFSQLMLLRQFNIRRRRLPFDTRRETSQEFARSSISGCLSDSKRGDCSDQLLL